MSIKLLEHIHAELKSAGFVRSIPEFCNAWLGRSEGYIRTLRYLPAEPARHHTIRNFSTLYWQNRNQEIFVRSYLTPEEMTVFGFAGVKIPRNINEPLNSEVRLGELVWRYRAQDFIRASEAAALKMMGLCCW